jgi:hypothetical protein
MGKEPKPPEPIAGERITVLPGDVFNFGERAAGEDRGRRPAVRKLPPIPGRGPTRDTVPADEILPKDRE